MAGMGRLMAVAVFAVGLLGSWPARAEQYSFAYVDVPRAMASSDAAKRARELLEKKLASKQREVDAMEQKIKSLKDDLEKRKGLMTPEARAETSESVRNKFREYQRLVEDNQSVIDRENGRWTKKISEAMREVIEEIGRERGYTIIFGKGQVLYASSAIDITDQVLKMLNKRTTSWF
ncbi:MAG: OmpH family outer membrane protein [Magnetococcales bacterium]|nr:OmpH family outer membrane protein [Magnetococcales bacterium]